MTTSLSAVRSDRGTSTSDQSLACRPLEGQRVAILGGSGRMGSATARKVVALGGEVLLIGRNGASLQEIVNGLGGSAAAVETDATDVDQLGDALQRSGPIHHIVVAISANARAAGIADTDPRTASMAFTRLWASYNAIHLAPKILASGGSVTLVSGSSARTPVRGYGVWTALHGAIEALAKAAAIDIAPLRVNVVSPGGIEMRSDRQLVERRNRASDIGMAVAALIANPAITDAVLDVDGGERKGTWPDRPLEENEGR